MRRSLLLCLIFAYSFQLSASIGLGHDQGNGGDLFAAEFVKTGEWLLRLLRYQGEHSIDLDLLESVIEHSSVESTDKRLRLNDTPKDAINYPQQKRILFDRRRWKKMDKGERAVLVLHEYLGLMKVENASYAFSKELLGRFNYGRWHFLECTFKDKKGGGDIGIGIDESAGMDTILLDVNFKSGADSLYGDVMLPVGEFSQMLVSGNVSMAFNGSSLLSLQPSGKAGGLKGHFAIKGKVMKVNCHVRKIDPTPFLMHDCQADLEADESE